MAESKARKVTPAVTTKTPIKNDDGSYIYTNADGTVQDYNNKNKRYILVEVASTQDCRKSDSKPSSYTHAGALGEARRQLDNAATASCAVDQNKFIRRAVELASYVESGTRQR